jgi:AcrR family transcriptional regulator
MRKIAALSGYGLTALYACFPAKRALLYVLWEDVFRELGEQLDRIAKATADPVERMRALAISTVWFWLDRPDDYRAIFLIEDRPEGPIDALFAITSESLRGLDVIRAAAAEAITAGRLSATDSQVVSRMLLTAVIGLAHALVCIPEYDWGDRDALVTGTFKALIEGLKSDKTG